MHDLNSFFLHSFSSAYIIKAFSISGSSPMTTTLVLYLHPVFISMIAVHSEWMELRRWFYFAKSTGTNVHVCVVYDSGTNTLIVRTVLGEH